MADVLLYTLSTCPFCIRAKRLLDGRSVAYREVVVDADPEARREVMRRTGHPTFPQIFIGDRFVGGCDDLHALDREGALDSMLA